MIIVITNQSAINRGLTTHENVEKIHSEIQSFLNHLGTKIDRFYYCPHTPSENCDCRKPKPGLICKAISDYNIDVNLSWFIGDSETDIEAGKSIGCKTLLVTSELNLEQCIEKIIYP